MTSELLSGLAAANLAAALAIILVLALRSPLRRLFGAALAYRLWLIPLVAAAAVFIPVPKGLAPSLPAAAMPQEVLLIFAPNIAPPVASLAAAAPGPAFSLPVLLLATWLVGVAIAVGLTLLAHRRGMKSFGRLKATGACGPLRAARNGLGPALVGVVRPRLVLPADFEMRFSEREQALILAHERHHGQSGDPRINALAVLLSCLNWFNPLVHLAAFQLRVDQELACDAAVVAKFPGERRTYAEALLKSQQACIPMPLGCTWPGRSPKLLQERLSMLACKTPGRARLMAGSVLVGALCLGAGAAAWAASAATPPSAAPAAARTIPSTPPAAAPLTSAPAASTPAPVEAIAPTTIAVGCFSNACGGAIPRDAAAVDAAIKAGDGKAVLASGGNATDAIAAFKIADARTGNSTFPAGVQPKAGTEQFLFDPEGRPVVSMIMDDGSRLMMLRPEMNGFVPPSGTLELNELEGRPKGSVPIREPTTLPNGNQAMMLTGYRAPDGTVMPLPARPNSN